MVVKGKDVLDLFLVVVKNVVFKNLEVNFYYFILSLRIFILIYNSMFELIS